jgi:hypothetical protein
LNTIPKAADGLPDEGKTRSKMPAANYDPQNEVGRLGDRDFARFAVSKEPLQELAHDRIASAR